MKLSTLNAYKIKFITINLILCAFNVGSLFIVMIMSVTTQMRLKPYKEFSPVLIMIIVTISFNIGETDNK